MTGEGRLATVLETVDLFSADAMAGTVGTRVTYRAALMALMAFLAERQVDVAGEVDRALNVRLLLDWATWLLAERQIAPRTLMLYLAALASYVKWLQVTGRWTLDGRDVLAFGAGMKQIRRMQRPARGRPHPPTGDEVGRILRAASEVAPAADDARGRLIRLRDMALVEVLRCTGLRASEVLSLRRKQLRQDGGLCHAWVIGKGRKEREVFFDDAAWQAIQGYLAARAGIDGATGRPLGELPVFARHDRRAGVRVLPLTVRALEDVMGRLVAVAGLVEQGITPHSLRHYFATKVYRATHDLGVTQEMMGHSSPVTTRVYAEMGEGAARDAHAMAFG